MKHLLFIFMLSILAISCSKMEVEEDQPQLTELEEIKLRNVEPMDFNCTNLVGTILQSGDFAYEDEDATFLGWNLAMERNDDPNTVEIERDIVISEMSVIQNEDSSYALWGLTIETIDGVEHTTKRSKYTLTEVDNGDGTISLFTDGDTTTTTCSGCTTVGPASADHCNPEKAEGAKNYHCSSCPTQNCVRSVSVTSKD